MLRKYSDIALWGLVLIGFLGALSISVNNINGNPCPHIVFVPICYVVLVAYGLMLGSLIINHGGCKHHFFVLGWAAAFLIALIGSLAEFFAGGGVCPSTGGGSLRGSTGLTVPMCYISLAMLVAILILFINGPYKNVCDIHNAPKNT